MKLVCDCGTEVGLIETIDGVKSNDEEKILIYADSEGCINIECKVCKTDLDFPSILIVEENIKSNLVKASTTWLDNVTKRLFEEKGKEVKIIFPIFNKNVLVTGHTMSGYVTIVIVDNEAYLMRCKDLLFISMLNLASKDTKVLQDMVVLKVTSENYDIKEEVLRRSKILSLETGEKTDELEKLIDRIKNGEFGMFEEQSILQLNDLYKRRQG